MGRSFKSTALNRDVDQLVQVRPDPCAVDPINVERNRGLGAGITEAVDLVKPRVRKADITGRSRSCQDWPRRPHLVIPCVKRFLQLVFVNRVGAPGMMGVRRAELVRSPHDRHDGKPTGGIIVHEMACIGTGLQGPLIHGQQIRLHDRPRKRGDDPMPHRLRRTVAGRVDLSEELRHTRRDRPTSLLALNGGCQKIDMWHDLLIPSIRKHES
jgi:hypothetical protein